MAIQCTLCGACYTGAGCAGRLTRHLKREHRETLRDVKQADETAFGFYPHAGTNPSDVFGQRIPDDQVPGRAIRVLDRLAGATEPLSMRQLACDCRIGGNMVSEILENLFEAGFIERESTGDGYKGWVLTSRAEKYLSKTKEVVDDDL